MFTATVPLLRLIALRYMDRLGGAKRMLWNQAGLPFTIIWGLGLNPKPLNPKP